MVESIYYDNQPLPPNINERDILSLLNGEMLNGDIILAFLTSLVTTKQNLKTEIIQILRNMGKEEKRSVFIKYLVIDDFLKNDIIFAPINAKNSHWVLLVLYPKEWKGVYLDSLLSFTNIHETVKPIF